MTGTVDWQVLVFVVTVFGGGVTLAWFFWSTIGKLIASFEKKIDEVAVKLEEKITEFDERDRKEHAVMVEQITQIRIAVGQLETKKERVARTKRKS